MSKTLAGFEGLISDFSDYVFSEDDLRELLPDGIRPLKRINLDLLISESPFDPFAAGLDIRVRPIAPEEDLVLALNLCAVLYHRLLRQEASPNTLEMLKRWKQMQRAAQALASLALGGGGSEHPDRVQAAWMRRDPKFKNYIAHAVEIGEVELDPGEPTEGGDVLAAYEESLERQSIPEGFFRGDVHPQVKLDLAQAVLEAILDPKHEAKHVPNADMQAGEGQTSEGDSERATITNPWGESIKDVTRFFEHLGRMLETLDHVIDNADGRLKANPPISNHPTGVARKWLAIRLLWIWRDVLGQDVILSVQKIKNRVELDEPIPNTCAAFVMSSMERIGCPVAGNVSSFVDVLRRDWNEASARPSLLSR